MIFAISYLINMIVPELVNKFPALYGIRVFITVFISDRHWTLSCARQIESVCSHLVSSRSILILSSHPTLSKWSLPTLSLCAFPIPFMLAISPLLNHLLATVFSGTLFILLSYVLLSVREQGSHPYKTTNEFIVLYFFS
jgi:hypothetical protein